MIIEQFKKLQGKFDTGTSYIQSASLEHFISVTKNRKLRNIGPRKKMHNITTNLVFKERVIQVDIKAMCKSDICRCPFNRICHIQCSTNFQWFWTLLREINMNNLQENSQLENVQNNSTKKGTKKQSHIPDTNQKGETWSLLYLTSILLWVYRTCLLSLFLSG